MTQFQLQVTTLLADMDRVSQIPQLGPDQLASLKQEVTQQGGAVKEAKAVRLSGC